MANKKPLSGSRDGYARLLESSSAAGRRIRYEATVGAGLPIIDTYRKLAETGDRVLRIDGCVSGTLMYVLSEVSAGRPFSAGGARSGRCAATPNRIRATICRAAMPRARD